MPAVALFLAEPGKRPTAVLFRFTKGPGRCLPPRYLLQSMEGACCIAVSVSGQNENSLAAWAAIAKQKRNRKQDRFDPESSEDERQVIN